MNKRFTLLKIVQIWTEFIFKTLYNQSFLKQMVFKEFSIFIFFINF